MPRKKLPPAEIVDVVPKQRATKRTPEVIEAILSGIQAGDPLRRTCEGVGIAASTFMLWVSQDEALAERYARAKRLQAELLAAELLEIADEEPGTLDGGATDSGRVADKRLRVDTRKWVLSKLLPKVYGDKVQTEHTGANGGPIQIISGIDRGDGL